MPRSRTASTAPPGRCGSNICSTARPTGFRAAEMQRVSIGRAIVRKPHVCLMDEPLSALDAKLREALRTELKNLQMQLGATFLFVTHDQIEAMSMGDKVGVLNHGRIVQTGTPYEIYNNPRDTYVASFVGSPPMNLIDGKLVNGRAVKAPLNFELPFQGEPRRMRRPMAARSSSAFGPRMSTSRAARRPRRTSTTSRTMASKRS